MFFLAISNNKRTQQHLLDLDEELGLLEFAYGDGPFAGAHGRGITLLEAGLLGHLLGRIDVELEGVHEVECGGGTVLHGDVVFQGVLTHGHVASVLQVLVGLGDALEDHAIKGDLLGALLGDEVARQGGAVEHVHAVLGGDHLLAVGALPGHACGGLGVDKGTGAVLVLQDVCLQVGAGLLEGAVAGEEQ